MKYYSYPEFITDTKSLLSKLQNNRPEAIVALARGGITLGHFLSNALDNRNLFCMNAIHYENNVKRDDDVILSNIPNLEAYKSVLIVDEIVDSGETMEATVICLEKEYPDIRFRTATLFQKETAIFQCDYSEHNAVEWIEFFWEKDLL
jgi:xanthine phosphoribosyltransferase